MRQATTREMRRRGAGGFTLVELLIVVAILGILAAIAVPQFIGARRAHRERQLVEYMRGLGAAAKTYRTASGRGVYPDKLTTLTTRLPGETRPLASEPDATLNDTSLRVSDWTIRLVARGANHFECQATPDGGGNPRRLAVFEDGTPRQTTDGTAPTRDSQALK